MYVCVCVPLYSIHYPPKFQLVGSEVAYHYIPHLHMILHYIQYHVPPRSPRYCSYYPIFGYDFHCSPNFSSLHILPCLPTFHASRVPQLRLRGLLQPPQRPALGQAQQRRAAALQDALGAGHVTWARLAANEALRGERRRQRRMEKNAGGKY